MTELEQQLGNLLKDAPGEPPVTLDPDAAKFVPAARRRYLAPVLTAIAVLLVAASVALLLAPGSSHPAPAVRAGLSGSPGQMNDARTNAVHTAETIIDTAPMVPGATLRASAPLASLNYAHFALAGHYVQRTRFWTAPNTLTATIAYLQIQRPTGMSLTGSGRAIGPGGEIRAASLDFQANKDRSLAYAVVPYNGGVAVRVDAQVVTQPH